MATGIYRGVVRGGVVMLGGCLPVKTRPCFSATAAHGENIGAAGSSARYSASSDCPLGRWQWPGSCRGVLSCDAAAGIPKPGRISRCRIDLGGRPHRAASGVALELNQAANLAVQVWERLGDYG